MLPVVTKSTTNDTCTPDDLESMRSYALSLICAMSDNQIKEIIRRFEENYQ